MCISINRAAVAEMVRLERLRVVVMVRLWIPDKHCWNKR
jgi:hypothetical protein